MKYKIFPYPMFIHFSKPSLLIVKLKLLHGVSRGQLPLKKTHLCSPINMAAMKRQHPKFPRTASSPSQTCSPGYSLPHSQLWTTIAWQRRYPCVKGYLHCKSIFSHTVALDVQLINFFSLKKKCFVLEMSRFLCFCEIHKFQNLTSS